MKKNLLLVVTLVLAGSIFAQEYKIFYSGTTEGVVTITKDAKGRITIIPQVNDMYYMPPDVCPIIPKYLTGGFQVPFYKDIVIEGNTATWTESKDGSWIETVYDGNTTRIRHSNGFWAKTVVDGNTTTTTSSDGSWEKIVVDGNTTTMINSYGQWETTVITGNTTTVSHSNGNRKEIVVDGNTMTSTSFFSKNSYTESGWMSITKIVVNKQGYNIYIEQTDKNHMTLEKSGRAHYDRGNYDQAITDFTEAIKMNPSYFSTYRCRGDAYYQQKDYDRAIADYTEALRLLGPGAKIFDYIYTSRGNAYWGKKDYVRARADYEKALQFDPNNTAARNNLEKLRNMGY